MAYKTKTTKSGSLVGKSKKGNFKTVKLFPSKKKKTGVSSNVNTMVGYSVTGGGKRYMVISEKKKVFRTMAEAKKALNKKN